MHKMQLVGSTALGIMLGAVLFNSVPAWADMAVIDVASIAKETGILDVLDTINSVENDVKSVTQQIFGALGDNTFGTVQQLLQEGFTQQANYSKAQIGAQEQITDASNTAKAQFQLGIRDAQIRDEQTPSPAACVSLDGGVGTQAAAIQAYDLYQALTGIHNERAEAASGMPSYYGTGQGVASNAANHVALYCDATDVAAGLCSTPSSKPDADQQYGSLIGPGTYPDQTSVVAAKDYAVNLIEPVAPGALRGDQLNSVAGQDAAVQRRSFNARMSLAQSLVDQEVAFQTQSVPTTAIQQQYLADRGLPAQQDVSWLQSLQIEAERRFDDVTWAAWMANAPPAAVEREIATELALSNYLAYQQYKLSLQHATISAAQLAETAQHDFMPTVRMPVPSMAAN